MIQTASILWAVLATGGAVAVYLLMRREVAKARKAAAIARDTAAHERLERDAASSAYRYMTAQYHRVRTQFGAIVLVADEETARRMELEGRLLDIKARRKASAKHARQAQLSQQRAKVLEQASKLVAPKVDRIAA